MFGSLGPKVLKLPLPSSDEVSRELVGLPALSLELLLDEVQAILSTRR